jgi:hypothetical protein
MRQALAEHHREVGAGARDREQVGNGYLQELRPVAVHVPI